MDESTPVELDADDRDSFLGNGGTGVISLSNEADAPPHSIPVSYGYDAGGSTFYFRLAVGPDTEKGDLQDRPVSFVVAEETDDGWRSVVATGRLEATESEGIATETLEGLDHVHIPLVDIFGKPTRATDFEFYRLVPEQLTGRKEAPPGI
jgi:hypothetical protein